jgi:predicted nucleic acid-binding Zn finger protein
MMLQFARPSKAAIARILGCRVSQIRRFEVWEHVCFVVVSGRRPTLISLKAFQQDHLALRLQGSASVEVIESQENHFGVFSYKTEKIYVVDTHSGSCTCPDWEFQMQRGCDHPTCKHMIRVAKYIEQAA